ncbi:hypothetical protein [Salinicola halophilus]|uniref:hypothetical protein n=1 Tax=Salinicola halophilus TaxID=184065 RepID=UPI0013A66BA3|nr:hypothetical protein [Salinicola halophilus]
MSFWKKTGSLALKTAKVGYATANVLANQVEAQSNEINQLHKDYKNRSNKELLEIIESTGFFAKSYQEKGAARSILRQRKRSQSEHNYS